MAYGTWEVTTESLKGMINRSETTAGLWCTNAAVALLNIIPKIRYLSDIEDFCPGTSLCTLFLYSEQSKTRIEFLYEEEKYSLIYNDDKYENLNESALLKQLQDLLVR